MLEEIATRDPALDSQHESALWDALETLLGNGAVDILRASVRLVLLRTLELTLLGDPRFVELARYPHSYLGDAHIVIEERLKELFPGQEILPIVVEHLRSCLLSGVGVENTKRSTAANVEAVLVRCAARTPDRALRCEICGYHFVEDDLGESRRAIAQSIGARFAEYRLTERVRDVWKPVDLSVLSVDHVIPEAALGPTSDENLQVTCKFCNSAKAIYRWPGEGLSRDNAGSLSLLVGGSRMRWAVNASVFTAIALAGRCFVCARGVTETELTACRADGGRGPGSMAPWGLRAVCYGCVDIRR
jgi:hypothetical protein